MNTSPATTFDYDVVIIGSGVAGALVARQLAQAGRRVCILEAGERTDRAQAVARMRSSWQRDLQAPYAPVPWAAVPDERNPAAYFGNQSTPSYAPSFLKTVGGTTWHWTGMTPRLLPADFELRSRYGVGVDWPLTYADLEPWYLKAEHALGVAGDSSDDHGSPRSGPYPMPPIPLPYSDQVLARHLAPQGLRVAAFPAARNSRPFDGRPACCGNNTCTPLCPIGASYSADTDIAKAEQSGARLIVRATVCQLEVDVNGQISAAHYLLPDGSRHRLTARRFVVACNGIETPRLLLMSASARAPRGVANTSDQVGRNFMDHPMFMLSFEMPEPLYLGRGPLSVSGILAGRDGAFRQQHAAAKLYIGNDLSLQQQATHLVENLKHWGNTLSRLRQSAIHQGQIGAEIELLPHAHNRITLDQQRHDPLGLPLPQVTIQLSAYEVEGLRYWQDFMEQRLTRSGARITQRSTGSSAHHPSGAVRMGHDAATAVANADCRSHDHANLYFAGSALFPTVGTANPTLTIAALSLRLADHLCKF